MKRNTVVRTAVIAAVLAAGAQTAHAQLGSGWQQFSPTKKIHLDDDTGLQTFNWTSSKSVCTPVCADYLSSSGTETFRILDSRSNRAEIRLENDYTSGIYQFEGYVTFYSPLHDESLFQIFGNSGDGATYAMMRGYRDNGGEIRVMGGSHVIASGVYGKEVRINVIHKQNAWSKWYVNGALKLTIGDTDTAATNYWKYGCYGTTNGNVPAEVHWRNVKTFQNGTEPSGNPTATATKTATATATRTPTATARARATATRTATATATATGGTSRCSGIAAFKSCTAYASGASVTFNNALYHSIAAIPSTRDCPPNSPYDPSNDNWWVNDGGC
jgi:hypothetical protein